MNVSGVLGTSTEGIEGIGYPRLCWASIRNVFQNSKLLCDSFPSIFDVLRLGDLLVWCSPLPGGECGQHVSDGGGKGAAFL